MSSGYDHAICLWSTTSFYLIRTFRHHTSPVHVVRFSVEGSVLVSGDEDGRVLLVRTADGMCLRNLEGHKAAVSSIALAEAIGVLFSAGNDGFVRVWSLRGKCLRAFKAHNGNVLSMDVSGDQDYLCTTGDDFCAHAFPFSWKEKVNAAGDVEITFVDDSNNPKPTGKPRQAASPATSSKEK